MTASSGPLAGIRIVEFGRFVTAPYAARLLGDLGADVIKLEGLDGDPFRVFSGEAELSPHFVALNRNKRSIAVDVKDDRGRRLLADVAASADVFLENSRPGSMERLGLDQVSLTSRNPRLIYCSITGTGASGPYVQRPAYDMVGQALSGMAHLSIPPDSEQVTGTNTADSVTGLTAALAILAALRHRDTTGLGGQVDVDMLSSSMSFLGAEIQIYLDTDRAPGPLTRPANSLSFAFACADGRRLGVHLSSVQKFWVGLLSVLEREELLTDDRFATRALRSAHYEELRQELQRSFATRPRDAWVEALVAADVPAAPINDIADVVADPQVEHLGLIRTTTHADLGTIRTVASPARFSRFSELPLTAPPRLGEHSRDILRDLGLDGTEVASLVSAGVVSTTGGSREDAGEEPAVTR